MLDHNVSPSEIGIITPYRAQASYLEGLLRRASTVSRAAPIEKSPPGTEDAGSCDPDGATNLTEDSSNRGSSVGGTIFRARKLCAVAQQPAPKLTAVSAATVDSFQGSEKLVIIMSLVQATDAHSAREAERSEHINFPNRVNVAITRAVSHLVVFQSYQFSGDNLTSYTGKMTLKDSPPGRNASPWAKLIAYTVDVGHCFIGTESLLNQLGTREIEYNLPLFSELHSVQKEVVSIAQEPSRKTVVATSAVKRAPSLSDQLLIDRVISCVKSSPVESKCVLSLSKSAELLKILGGEW